MYIGPDTSVTHLAAGSGCPTVALYGPTSPRLVGPWPVGGLDRPWAPSGRLQRRGNVWLVQNPLACLPCERLGCDGYLESRSQCLDELGADQVLMAVDQALAAAGGRACLAQPPKARYGMAGQHNDPAFRFHATHVADPDPRPADDGGRGGGRVLSALRGNRSRRALADAIHPAASVPDLLRRLSLPSPECSSPSGASPRCRT